MKRGQKKLGAGGEVNRKKGDISGKVRRTQNRGKSRLRNTFSLMSPGTLYVEVMFSEPRCFRKFVSLCSCGESLVGELPLESPLIVGFAVILIDPELTSSISNRMVLE